MNRYFHADLETTNLDASTGHIRSIGWVVTDGALNELDHGHLEQAVPAPMWDKGTLEWAYNNYSPEYMRQFEGWAITVDTWDNWQGLLTRLLKEFYASVAFYSQQPEVKCWLICNHPDFDATMLRVASKITGLPFPFKHDRVLDMASLLMGSYNGFKAGAIQALTDAGIQYEPAPKDMEPKDILNELGFTKEAVAHTALEDARRQVSILAKAGVRLPL